MNIRSFRSICAPEMHLQRTTAVYKAESAVCGSNYEHSAAESNLPGLAAIVIRSLRECNEGGFRQHRLDKGIPFEGKVLIPKNSRHDGSFMIEFVIDAESCAGSKSSILLMLHQQKLRVGFSSSMDVYRVRVQATNRLGQ